ncbi:MAG: HAMP domain-containing histidine kinase [Alphaproteobacteria bacterium]|nr:HAMP domain-containing histidine kinase [Alphaproteobacteria bacterium]
MPGPAKLSNAWRLVAHSLSGRLLLLTLLYVLLTEAVIFAPSIGRYHHALLQSHVESAEIAILPLTEAAGEKLSTGLREQLLMRAGANAVVLRRPEEHELFLVTQTPRRIDFSIDLREDNVFKEIWYGLDCLANGGNRFLRIMAPTKIRGAQGVDVILGEKPIHDALALYAGRTALLALLLSSVTAVLVFFSLYFVLVRPMGRITRAMTAFRENPEDASRIIAPSARRDEIGIAERELATMQRDIYGSLQQRGRLAALGMAVAKIQHDLRNILASAQLASDRLAASEDPVVKRLAPRLISAIDHAVALATNTLRYGRAEEHAPERRRVTLKPLVEDAGEAALAERAGEGALSLIDEVPAELQVDADPEQLFRIVLNLVRNAEQAVNGKAAGEIRVSASRNGKRVLIHVADNGPGVPEKVRDRLFQPFAGSARSGGSGLGLVISRELARAHGGDISLIATGPQGTTFRVEIPDRETA